MRDIPTPCLENDPKILRLEKSVGVPTPPPPPPPPLKKSYTLYSMTQFYYFDGVRLYSHVASFMILHINRFNIKVTSACTYAVQLFL